MKTITLEQLEAIKAKAIELITYADSVGLNVEITRVSDMPPSTGSHKPSVQIWLKREFTRPE